MTETQQFILDVFKEHQIGLNQNLAFTILLGKIWKWSRQNQDNFKTALQTLNDEGYIKAANGTLTLLEKGHQEIS